jgi:hypothetical protein
MAGWPVRWRAAATARCRTASELRAGMPSPWRVKALRSDGRVVPEFRCGGVDAAQPLGELEGAFGLGPVGQEPAGLPAQRVAVVPAPLLGSHSAMSECCRSRRRAVRRHRADPAAAGSLSLDGAPQHGAWAG